MFEFQCGDLIDVRRRQTSAYTVGRRILVSTVSNVKQLSSKITVAKSDSYADRNTEFSHEVIRGYEEGTEWAPYSYGNPAVNLGGNLLYRVFKESGLIKDPYDKELY